MRTAVWPEIPIEDSGVAVIPIEDGGVVEWGY